MPETTTAQIEVGTQVTTSHGVGIVTWVEIGGDEFRVLMYDRPHRDFLTGQMVGTGPDTVTVDRAHIAFWPPRKTDSSTSTAVTPEGTTP